MLSRSVPAILVFFLALQGSAARADLFTWSNTVGGIPVSGTANFSLQVDAVSGYDLVISLNNTSTQVQGLTSAVVTGFFFNITSQVAQGALAMQTATAVNGLIDTTGTTVIANSANSNICAANSPNPSLETCSVIVDGGWEAAYNSAGFLGNPNGITPWGIGTAGFGIFNGHDVNFADFGLVSTAGINTSQGGFGNATPYTFGNAVFVLSGLTTNQIKITNVETAYGTVPDATPAAQLDIPPSSAPEPTTFLYVGSALIVLSFGRLLGKQGILG